MALSAAIGTNEVKQKGKHTERQRHPMGRALGWTSQNTASFPASATDLLCDLGQITSLYCFPSHHLSVLSIQIVKDSPCLEELTMYFVTYIA